MSALDIFLISLEVFGIFAALVMLVFATRGKGE